MSRQPETVILVEPDGANPNGKLRTMQLKFPISRIVERCHLDPKDPLNPAKQWTRTWVCTDGERDDSGQCRVFREELPPPPKEEVEKPLYDETVLKEPLKLGVNKPAFERIGKWLGKK